MEVINKIKTDLLKPGLKPMINAMQADENSRVLEITLNANGAAWEIPAGVSFSMAYKKPDGTQGLYDTLPNGTGAFSVDGNVVSVTLAPQMLTTPGTVTASVVISCGDQRVSTFPVIVNVIQNPAVGAVGSEDYYYSSVIGDLDDLKTANKTSLVAAINEIFSTGGGSGSGQNPTVGGLTTEQVNALDGMFKVCAFIKADVSAEYNAFLTAFGISGGGEEEPDTPVEPDEPATPEKTLTSISATYSGGNVTAGTAVTALSGVVVTAHYSDGTSETVTGYTLSGTIVEGENTVTVTYEGLATTFTVTGIEAVVDENAVNIYDGFVSMSSTATSAPETNSAYPNAVCSEVMTIPYVETDKGNYEWDVKLNSNITDTSKINWKVYDSSGSRVQSLTGENSGAIANRRGIRLNVLDQTATSDGSNAEITGFTITVYNTSGAVAKTVELGINDLRG